MLYPKLSNCPDCNTIPALVGKIDCKIAELSNNLYNNTVFILNKPVNGTLMNDLLNYRRILSYKYCNPDYASCYTVNMIASRVNLLTAGARNCNNCGKTSSNCDDKPSGSTTTTTSSSSSTTSSTSSTTSSTSSTTSSTSSTTSSTTTPTPPQPRLCTYTPLGGGAPSGFQIDKVMNDLDPLIPGNPRSYNYQLNSFIVNGVEHASGETLSVTDISQVIFGMGLDGNIYLMNISDWMTSVSTLLDLGFVFYDNMRVIEYPNTVTSYSINIERLGPGGGGSSYNYYYSSTNGFALSSPTNTYGNYTCI